MVLLMWDASVEENHWLTPEDDEGLSRLTWPQVGTQLADKELDKAFVLCVSGQGGLLRLCGREWDRMTRQLSVRHERFVGDRRALTNELGVLIHDLFRPLVLIESVDAGKGVTGAGKSLYARNGWHSGHAAGHSIDQALVAEAVALPESCGFLKVGIAKWNHAAIGRQHTSRRRFRPCQQVRGLAIPCNQPAFARTQQGEK